ncbi:MAG: type I glutamate--ammonia ligase [Legionellales bacterium RIFCSPHIGHO2_12_FULL_42_9]|nr:MAG: type I glutamate--ammonia ligase [Legionellales bacterium RIFCSPHIGHO2_12_FULL_42_9]
MTKATLLEAIKEHNAKFLDFRFTDTRGKEQHITLPVSSLNDELIEEGKMIDGSSFIGWQKIHLSDLALIPDLHTLLLDPFYQDATLIIRCNVSDPQTQAGYDRCPRTIAERAEAYLRKTGIADDILFGPEPEFFIFDDARWETHVNGCFYKVDSDEGQWNSGKTIDGGNIGHRPGIKGGYFPVPPVDSSQDIRSAIALTLESLGMVVEAHHHEVATANQCEIATRYDSLVHKADQLQLLKYVVHNVAHNYGKTATFMPKPLVGDNGSGLHCHISLRKGGKNLFSGKDYAGLSETALFFIGGVIKHAKALNALTNPSTNSYRRLVPGFEAPVLLAYSACNRSAAIRIPYVADAKAARIEIRFPDSMGNPYLAFSAMMMAGLDGIKHKIHPGQPIDKDLYELPAKELKTIPMVASTLDEAVQCLKADHQFLLEGGVFSNDFIANYIESREAEITQIRSLVHPFEFELYYSL